MEILRNFSSRAPLPRGGVVSIGNFDGVHRGHQQLLRQAVERAHQLGVPSVAVTFHPHPEKVLRPSSGLKLLTTREQKAQLLALLGVGTLIELPFTRELAATSAESFARQFLAARLAPREVRLGKNFRFGHQRQGDVEFLSRLGEELGFRVLGMEPAVEGGAPISSTRVREALATGAVEEAWRLLGRPYFLDARVLVGKRLGRQLGFPTLNLEVENELLPQLGVYVTAVHVPSFGRVFPSVTNVGMRPTLYVNDRVLVESHVLDFTADLYREPVRLFFFARLREERVFPHAMALAEQVRRDVAATREYFAKHGLPERELILR